MKYILTIVLATMIALPVFCQSDSGIFLSVQCAKKSPRQTVLITNKQVCLAANPIILATEFTAVTDVRLQADKISFDLTLSQKAAQTLMQISANLPNSTFALVVEKDIFYVFPASDLTVNRTFRFQGTGKDQQVFNNIQKKLKTIVASRTQ